VSGRPRGAQHPVIAAAAAAVGGLFVLRALAHWAILRGLRAPRLPHPAGEIAQGGLPSSLRELHIAGPNGRRLFARLVLPQEHGHGPWPVVLAMHGWGANAGLMWPVVPPLRAAGFATLLLDARCHGRSDDEDFSSLPRFAEDIAAGLDWLRQQPEIAADRIALLGHSVGAGAAILHASRQHDVRAVVSLSAFAHPREVMRRLLAQHHIPFAPIGWYILRHVQRVIGTSFDAIAPLNTLPRVRCPVLLVHGRDDRTVPFDDALRLRAVSQGAELLALEGDHDLSATLAPRAGVLVDFLTAACLAGKPD